jgi:exodeoxyribonuclease-3
MPTKIISYNVNGLRAATAKGLTDWLKTENPDILCIQESKLQEGQIDTLMFELLGYSHYWHYAEKKGYSGVAIFTKLKPDEVFTGIGHADFDSEGRLIACRFGSTWVMSAYFPSGSSGDTRQGFKMQWLEEFYSFITKFKISNPNLIISGDYNICHKPIDINFPNKHLEDSGFLPEEREWMDKFEKAGFVDSFRVFNQQAEQYSWWSYRANSRAKNLGWRIDYHWVSEPLKPFLKSAFILPNAYHSDHCPVGIEIELM